MAALDRDCTFRIAGLAQIGLLTGAFSALATIVFVEAIFWLNNALFVSANARIQLYVSLSVPASAAVTVPAIGGLVVGQIVSRWVAERRALGPPGAIFAIGIGDYAYPELGYPTNAELVREVARLAKLLGREVATPEDPRKMIRVSGADERPLSARLET